MPQRRIGYWTHRFLEKGVAARGAGEALRRDRAGRSPIPTACSSRSSASPAPRPSRPGAAATSRPSMRSAASTASRLLLEQGARRPAAILTDVFGFKESAREGAFTRYQAPGDAAGQHRRPSARPAVSSPGAWARGSVHHIAFRAADDAEQAAMARKLVASARLQSTEQKDRNYFRSVYFREPGGILFEIATDEPGFAVDEPVATLGRDLKLPPFLEARRARDRGRACPPIACPLKGPHDERALIRPSFRAGGAAGGAPAAPPARHRRRREPTSFRSAR